MEILEGFDVTGSYRDAGELAGCSPNTVIRYVAARQAGELVAGRRRVHRPWVPGPGVWAQYECADGLRIAGVLTYPLTDNEKTVTVERLRLHPPASAPPHLCQTSGDSVRLSQALTGQGVNALT